MASCSVCTHQRKRCAPDCIFRKHFPATRFDEFKQVHKVFGIANVTKMIRGANNSPEAEDEIVNSLCWEADSWAKDPVHGPYGLFKNQERELHQLRREYRNRMQLDMIGAVTPYGNVVNGGGNVINGGGGGGNFQNGFNDNSVIFESPVIGGNWDSVQESYGGAAVDHHHWLLNQRFLEQGVGNGSTNHQMIRGNGQWRELQGRANDEQLVEPQREGNGQ